LLRESTRVRSQLAYPAPTPGVPVVDAHGRTVMPALMDNHYHFWDYQQGPFLLSRGITNIRDPGAPLSLSMNFKEAIAMGLFPGPDIYSAGPLIDGLGDYHPLVDVMIDDTAAAATVVRAFKAQHLGELPSQLESNVQILSGLQAQLQATQRALDGAQQQKLYFESLLQQYQSAQASLEGTGSTAVQPDLLAEDIGITAKAFLP